MMRKILRKKRIFFKIEDCKKCRVWMEFIEGFNSNVDAEDEVRIVDCTLFNLYKIVSDPLIRAYDEHTHRYPTLFWGIEKIDGANTVVEAKAWLRTKMHEDFNTDVNNPYYFNKKCEFLKKPILGQKVICSEEEDV